MKYVINRNQTLPELTRDIKEMTWQFIVLQFCNLPELCFCHEEKTVCCGLSFEMCSSQLLSIV